jgi:hypothetical protein
VNNIINKSKTIEYTKAIYIDSLEAYKRAVNDKLNYPIYTDNPVLAHALRDKGVINVDNLIARNENFILGKNSLKIADEIDNRILSINDFKNIDYIKDLTLARPLGIFISSLLYRAAIFARFIKINNIKEIYIYINEKWSIDTRTLMETKRFGNILSVLCDMSAFEKGFKYKIVVCKQEKNERLDSSINSVLLKSLIFPLLVNIRELLVKTRLINNFRFNKQINIIGDPDGILREALPRLNLMGYKEKIFPKIVQGVSHEFKKLLLTNNVKKKIKLNNKSIKTIDILKSKSYNLDLFLSNKELDVLAKIIDGFIDYNILHIPLWVESAKLYVKNIIDNNKNFNSKIILATALSSPLAKIVHNILKYHDYKIILFEHGVTKGISALSSRRLHISEIYNADHFVGYSDGSVSTLNKLLKENKVKSFITAAPIHNKKVLFSPLQKIIWRKKLNIKSTECALIHVSPFPYSGNRRLGYGAPTETEVFDIEESFIKIYNEINKKVYYKKYPAYRFPFNFSLENIFSNYNNIKFVSDLDYRYMRSAFDIIVTGSPTSTFSWCLSANKPLIFFDSKIINPLIGNNVREKIKKSVFYINLDNKIWKNKLSEILNRPYKSLIKEWNQMYVDRKKFIKEYIFCDSKNPGTKVANYINNLIIK